MYEYIKQYNFVYIMDHTETRAATGIFKQHLMEQYAECRLYKCSKYRYVYRKLSPESSPGVPIIIV